MVKTILTLALALAIVACSSNKNSAPSSASSASPTENKASDLSAYPFNGEGVVKIGGDENREIALSPAQGDAVFCYTKDKHFNLVAMTNLSKNLKDVRFEQVLTIGFSLDSANQIPKEVSFPKLDKKDSDAPVITLVGAPGSSSASYAAWDEPCVVKFDKNDELLQMTFECRLNGVTSAEATKKVVTAKADIICKLENRSEP